ncbi:MAG: NCS2 family permease [bacterium]|nr:NCS2 family permease [Candidatus Aquidulcis frankliniae]
MSGGGVPVGRPSIRPRGGNHGNDCLVLPAQEAAPSAAAIAAVTALGAGLLTILMGVVSNYPFALAAGMGLNAVVAYTLVSTLKLSWSEAMAVIVWEGIFITILMLTGFRKAILEAIPLNLKRAIAVGIGLFLLLIGLFEANVIVKSFADTVPLGLFSGKGFAGLEIAQADLPTLAIFGAGLLTALALIRRPGGILVSIAVGTAVALVLGVSKIPTSFVSPLDASNFVGIGQAFGSMFSVWSSGAGFLAIALAVFSIMLSDFFDTAGTMVGLGARAGLLNSKGELPGANRVLLVDSIAAMAGGALGVSSNTTYIESAAGIKEGGRTGLTSVVTGLLFLAAVLLSPIAGIVPAAATAPALVIIGYLMFEAIRDVQWKDAVDGFPVLATLIVMPLSYSITDGIGVGFLTYAILKVTSGKARDVKPLFWVSVAAFVVYFLVKLGIIAV